VGFVACSSELEQPAITDAATIAALATNRALTAFLTKCTP